MDKGAHFYKTDFQVHTPRDPNWNGLGAKTDEERNAFAEELVLACRGKDLNAIAITDHHDIAFIPYIKNAALNELDDDGNIYSKENQLVVFPGMELTLTVPCQAILILDSDFPLDLLDNLYTVLAINQNPSSDEKNKSVERINFQQFSELVTRLDEQTYLKGKYIILPNVSEGGTFTLLRSGMHGKYAEMPCVGGYLDGSAERLGTGNKTILAGKNREYGFKPLSIFQTSDNRHRDYRLLGQHCTWIKWATPTAEALRQACLAKSSRIFLNEPQSPNVYIQKVQVSNSKFLGPIDLMLNHQYNAIIGGRGTGKSTILEYLRWGLADQPWDQDLEESPHYMTKRSKLIDNTLLKHDAVVTIDFVLNQVPHTVRRSTSKREINLKVGDEPFRICKEDELRNILPIQAYSQKQLSSVGVKTEELVRFLEAPISKELEKISEKLRQSKVEFRSTHESVRQRKDLQREIDKYLLEQTSLKMQIELIRKSIKGLSEADTKIITGHQRMEKEKEVIDSIISDLESLSELIVGLDEDLVSYEQNEEVEISGPNETAIKKADSEYNRILKLTKSKTNELTGIFDEKSNHYEGAEFNKATESWYKKWEESEEKYTESKARSSTHETTLKQVKELEERLKEITLDISKKTKALKKLGEPEKSFQDIRNNLKLLRGEKTNLILEQCQSLEELSGNYIKAELVTAGRYGSLFDKFKAAIKGSNIQADKVESLFHSLAESQAPLDEWEAMQCELELLIDFSQEEGSEKSGPHTPNLDRAGFTSQQKQRIGSKLTYSQWMEICLTDLEDLPMFLYKTRENEFIQFEDASAGQQATALMYVLLNQPGPPLIIDQPEDDLDSLIIKDIVEKLWQSKSRRQLIFASHNANLVVNGDAELVVVCAYKNDGDQTMGFIQEEGSIDNLPVRECVTSIMEGGEDAFRLRKDKYGF